MDDKLIKAKNILKEYNQEHLLYFYDELDEKQKETLLNQILTTRFNQILNLYKNSYNNNTFDMNTVSPLPHYEKALFSYSLISIQSPIMPTAAKSINW